MPYYKPEHELEKDGAARMAREIINRWIFERPAFCDDKSGTVEQIVTVDLVFAFSSSNEEHPLTEKGLPVNGKIKITTLLARSKGESDVELMLDGDLWRQLEPEERAAVIDSFLHGLEIQTKMEADPVSGDLVDTIKRDDRGRPKLKIKPHDFIIRGYHDVAERHGNALPAVQQLRAIFQTRDMRQAWFPFAEEVFRAEDAATNN